MEVFLARFPDCYPPVVVNITDGISTDGDPLPVARALCGLAGALEANRAEFISPAMMHWTKSGDLIVIVVLGGMGTLCGPIYGALAFLVLEELLSQLTEHWPVLFGVLLILIVLYARGGINSLLGKRSIGHG